jgi:DNA end-binding protein Ku
MRPIWTGAIGFGLVNIPVKLYSASQDSRLDLDMLDKKDHAKIKFKRVNEETGKEVKYEDIVKAYKYESEYVILNDKDFEAANAKKTKVIEIVEFVDQDEIDSIYYEQPYYLEPDKSGARPYALLREALKKTKKYGVATYVLRNKESLAILKPMDDIIVLNKIRFEEEIRSFDELVLPKKAEIKGKELEMAISLINSLSDHFDISAFKDTYSDELMKVIEAKAKGKKPTVKKMKIVHTKADDLMSQLKTSLEGLKKTKHRKAS